MDVSTSGFCGEIARQLGTTEFFKGLELEHRQALAAVCGRRRLSKGQTLFREGTPGHAVYLLTAGAVQLTKAAAGGRDVAIRIFHPPAFFAEVVLFEDDRYPVTARALAPSAVCSFPCAAIRRLLDRRAFREGFIAALMRRQRYLTERVRARTVGSAEERLLSFLREQFGDGPDIRVRIPKKDIAAAIGVKPETLSRLIRGLTERRVLAWRGERLQRFAPLGRGGAGSAEGGVSSFPVQQ